MAPRIARQIYAERSELDLLRKAGVVMSELAAIETEKECGRYEGRAPVIAYLVASAINRADSMVSEERLGLRKYNQSVADGDHEGSI